MSYDKAKKITKIQKNISGPCQCDCGCTKFNDLTRLGGFFISTDQCGDCDNGIHWDEIAKVYTKYYEGDDPEESLHNEVMETDD